MRVVLAVPDFEPAVGGTVRHGGLVARGLASRGHEVVVLTRRRDPSWPSREELRGLPVVRVGPPGTGRARDAAALVALAWSLRRRRRRVDVVQTLMWPDVATAAAVAGVSRRTVIGWAIRGEISAALGRGGGRARRTLGALRRRHLARCAHVTLTRAMDAELAGAGLEAESALIPVPVDTDSFRPPSDSERADARDALGVPRDAFVVCYVGHLERRKAVDRLVEAFRGLREERGDALLLIVGGGRGVPDDTDGALRALVETRRLGGAVRFCGVQPDPRPFLWAADVFALPSLREGMPNSLLEAMACGLACVAPPSAGGDELLDGETGVVPPSNEPADLLDALRELADDPERRARIGRAARARASGFGVDRVVERFLELYERVRGR
jgi:glycosyltransferase involved in cell wall biosynthesis